ncbi:MAG: hypothetical protein JSU95_17800, partial [Betaproteobacteria bacterium]
MEISTWFVVVFILMWIAGPGTQLLQLVAPKLHHKLGLTEADAFKPEFKWFLLEQKAIAFADMTYLVSGIAFIWLALLGNKTALIFGLYSCACYVYFAATFIPSTLLLTKNNLSPVSGKQLGWYLFYAVLFLV